MWTIKKNLILELIVGALILFVFLIYQIIDGYYAITVFMAIAGMIFLCSTAITLLLNRKRTYKNDVLKLVVLPVSILIFYMLVGAVSGSLI